MRLFAESHVLPASPTSGRASEPMANFSSKGLGGEEVLGRRGLLQTHFQLQKTLRLISPYPGLAETIYLGGHCNDRRGGLASGEKRLQQPTWTSEHPRLRRRSLAIEYLPVPKTDPRILETLLLERRSTSHRHHITLTFDLCLSAAIAYFIT